MSDEETSQPRDNTEMYRTVNGHTIKVTISSYGKGELWLNNTAIHEKHGNSDELKDSLIQEADHLEKALRNGNHQIVSNDRREQVYEATNRILEYAEATNPGGHTSETYHKVEEQVDTILSVIGVPDRIINE